ncbi:reverse transcriptase domain-containing protein [Tanacetum coccineum]|uniref:Reverse transcriptase domain-containing protein n=1 Tax=Tanacetum coccineum TaxID=301880 RepID=A0ABQ4WGF9_9ASTR
MGSRMKPTIFSDNVAKVLKTWHHTAKKNVKYGTLSAPDHHSQADRELHYMEVHLSCIFCIDTRMIVLTVLLSRASLFNSKVASNADMKKYEIMTPKKRTTRTSPATTTTTTTPITDAQLKTLIAQGVADVLAERDATRSRNGEDSHDLDTDCWSRRLHYAMTWTTEIDDDPKKIQVCQGEIKKLRLRLWNLKVKLPMWYDKKISTLAERQVENKRKLDNNNQAQQQPPKNQGVAITYTAEPSERKEYAGTLPLCNKCKFHHNGQCIVKCANYKRVGHLTRDCRIPTATHNQRNLTFYECGNQGHYRSDCSELKNQNHGNQARGTGARGMVRALGGGETNQDLNDIEDDINT